MNNDIKGGKTKNVKMNKIDKRPKKIKFVEMNRDNQWINNPEILLKYTQEFSDKSGSEPEYNPKIWNENNNIKSTHNCYSYSLGKIRRGLESKAQPGYASGFNHINDEDYNCPEFHKRLTQDVPGSYLEQFDTACRPGFYKIFLMLDPTVDYHWARMDSNKYWSHKPGASEVTNVDANGNTIKNPLKANWKYESLNYRKPCFFACIYNDLSKSISKVYKKNVF